MHSHLVLSLHTAHATTQLMALQYCHIRINSCTCLLCRGNACEYHCPDFDESSNTVCGNAGNCTIVADVSSLSPGERATQCVCNEGYIGGSCQLTCPRGDDSSVCGGLGRGTCILNDENAEAQCGCEDGFTGSVCQFSCPRDAAGNICGDHGKCVEHNGNTSPPMCDCDQGFTGPACQAQCPGLLAGSPCSGHGQCAFGDLNQQTSNGSIDIETASESEVEEATQDVVDQALNSSTSTPTRTLLAESLTLATDLDEETLTSEGGATCACDVGFGGSGCEKVCLRDGNGMICSGHGTCTTDGECQCEVGFVGPSCGGACPGVDTAGDAPCNENGQCQWNPQTDLAECKCDDGFLGPSCAYACPRGGDALDICSGKGQCLMQRGAPVCLCEEGIKGEACQLDCPGAAEQSVCNGHGFCNENGDETAALCTCDEGFLGSGCLTVCPGLQEDGTACSGNGACRAGETEQDPATCSCHDGYLGAGCEVKCPTDEFGNICAGAGKCELRTDPDGVQSAECTCFPGRVNYNCDTACPSNTADGTVCSGHGECEIKQMTDYQGHVRLEAICTCDDGYLGSDCFHGCPTAAGNTNQCSGHGVCKLEGGGAVCECTSGFSGSDCNTRVCGSQGSFYNEEISKCTCEAGFTCCSREGSSTDTERDAAIDMLQQENKVMVGKIRLMKEELATMVSEEA